MNLNFHRPHKDLKNPHRISDHTNVTLTPGICQSILLIAQKTRRHRAMLGVLRAVASVIGVLKKCCEACRFLWEMERHEHAAAAAAAATGTNNNKSFATTICNRDDVAPII